VCILLLRSTLCSLLSLSFFFPGKSRQKCDAHSRTNTHPNGLISDSFSLFCVLLFLLFRIRAFASGLRFFRYIHIHAQSEALTSSSSNLLLCARELLFGRRKTENVYDVERTQRRQRSKRNERKMRAVVKTPHQRFPNPLLREGHRTTTGGGNLPKVRKIWQPPRGERRKKKRGERRSHESVTLVGERILGG